MLFRILHLSRFPSARLSYRFHGARVGLSLALLWESSVSFYQTERTIFSVGLRRRFSPSSFAYCRTLPWLSVMRQISTPSCFFVSWFFYAQVDSSWFACGTC